MLILVTGGAGFIGSHVVDALLERGHDVRILDSLLPQAHRSLPDYLEGKDVRLGDLRDPDLVLDSLSHVDAVVHQAAMVGLGVEFTDAPSYVANNDLGTATLLAAMTRASVSRLVLASSMVVYGEGRYACPEHGDVRAGPRAPADLDAGQFEPRCPQCGAALESLLVDECTPVDPRNVYAATKVAQEFLVSSWVRATGSDAVALRYHNVYGPRMPRDTPYAGVAAIFRSALERGDAPKVYEDGRQRRDFVHVRDVAAANLAALDHIGGFRAFNIASGEPHTVGEMATTLAETFGGPAPQTTGLYRLGDVRHIVASPERARAELGFTAHIGFAEGIREFATAPLR